MEGVIVNFRKKVPVQKCNHIVIEVKGVESKEKAAELAGKAVMWKTPSGNEIKGKIAATHGNSGAVRAIMERGLPGICKGTKISIS